MALLIGPAGVSATLRRQLPYFGQGAIGLLFPCPNALSFRSVRYGNLTDTLIALAVAGGGNQIIRSKDRGYSWASIAEPNTRQWTGLDTDGRGRWVGVAQNGVAAGMAMYSDDDGLTWNPATMPSTNAWQDVCWAGGFGASARFVAVANTGVAAGQVAISTDGGATWAVSAGGAAVTRAWNAINYGNGVLIAVAYDGAGDQTMWSNDGGDSWNGVAESVTRQWDGIVFSPDLARWLAVALDSFTDNVMYSDDDGQSWTTGYCQSINADWSEVAWGNGRFCLSASNQGRVGISPDGRLINHIADSDPTSRQYYSVCWAYDRFVMTGSVIRIC
jgi:photosystem II stability/assembly factor-like uncharacterized protein